MVTDAARVYSAVFAPELFVLGCIVILVGYEWRAAGASGGRLRELGARLGVICLAWLVAFTVYRGALVPLDSVPEWGPDATGSAGLALGMLLVWAVWRERAWGTHVPTFALALVAVTVPHLLITPFWDISSHVLYALVPAGYLFLVTVRFAPVVLVGLGMVVARPLAGAHTWPESLGGLALSLVALVALFHRRSRRADRSRVAGRLT